MRHAEKRLQLVGIDSARIDAQMLATHVLRVDRSWLLAHPDHEFNELAGETLLQRRERREPLATILGWREFYGRRFGVTPDTLIPRQETETLVEAVLKRPIHEGASVLDIGTGSGCIAITLKLERPDLEITACDISPNALAIASANAKFLGANVRFIVSDVTQALLGEQFDLIVSNPPYIANSEELMPEVAVYEPGLALFSGDTGLEFYERLAREAGHCLIDGGVISVEVGYRQAESVREVFEGYGWTWLETINDLSGTPRVVVAMHSFD